MKIKAALVMILAAWSAGCSGRAVQKDEASSTREPATEATVVEDHVPPSDAERDAKTRRNTAVVQANTQAQADYHFSMAQAYSTEGNPDRAIEEFKLTLIYDPKTPLVYARLATEYVKKGQLTAAMETCKEALQRDPKYIDARLMLAGLYSTTRDNASAIAEYENILKQDPKHEEALIYRAQVLTEDGRPKDAAKSVRAFVKKVPDSALAWYYLGRLEQRLENTGEAVKAFKRAMVIKPSFAQAALALGFLYEELRMNAEAIEVYRKLFDQSQDLTAANRMATIFLKEERYKDAVPYLEAIEGNDPDDLNVRVKLGLVQMELKSYDKAIATFKAILERNPDSDRIHYYLGSLYEETGKPEEAIQELKKIKSDSKLYGDAILHVAYLHKKGERLDAARETIKEGLRASPRVAGFYLFQASMDEDAKDIGKAIGVLESAAELFPDDEKILYYLGSLFDRQGNVDKSLELMERILKVNSDNVDALNYIGYTWTVRGVRLGEAERLLRRALKLRPNNGYIQDSWGWHLFVRGRVAESVIELEKAARLKPDEATILEHLADAYLRMNLREKSAQQYQDAIRYADAEAKKKLEEKLTRVRTELAKAGRNSGPARMPAAAEEGKPAEDTSAEAESSGDPSDTAEE